MRTDTYGYLIEHVSRRHQGTQYHILRESTEYVHLSWSNSSMAEMAVLLLVWSRNSEH